MHSRREKERMINAMARTETERMIYAMAAHAAKFSWLRTLRAVLQLPETKP